MADKVTALAMLPLLLSEMDEDEDWDSSTYLDLYTLLTAKFISGSIRHDRLKISRFVEDVVGNYTNEEFRSKFRMTRPAFQFLCEQLEASMPCRNYPGGRKEIPLLRKVLLVIWYLSTTETLRSIAERFNVSESTAFYNIQEVTDILVDIRKKFIKWPSTDAIPHICSAFQRINGFPKVVGAIDGTHIHIALPSIDGQSYFNRKKFPSIILQGVCDHDGMFIDCYTGWPGSVHDARVWRVSDLHQSITDEEDKYFPDNTHLLGDCAYPLSTTLLTPYRDNGHLSEAKKTFNRKLSSVRSIIERAFALLKGRWRRLKYVDIRRTEVIPSIIMACCVIHNICLQYDQTDDFLDPDQDVGNDDVAVYRDSTSGCDKRDAIMTMFQ